MSRVQVIRRWAASGALALLLAGGSLHAAPTPLAAFLSARRGLSSPAAAPALLATAQQDPGPFAGRVFELPAAVCGLITDGGQQTVLLSVDGGPTLAARLPASLRDVSWMDSGMHLRALVLVERAGNEQSLSNLRLLSAAPEDEVAAADRQEAAQAAARQAARTWASVPSRSLAYQRQGYSRTAEDLGGAAPSHRSPTPPCASTAPTEMPSPA